MYRKTRLLIIRGADGLSKGPRKQGVGYQAARVAESSKDLSWNHCIKSSSSKWRMVTSSRFNHMAQFRRWRTDKSPATTVPNKWFHRKN
jgi:hypothetical protein